MGESKRIHKGLALGVLLLLICAILVVPFSSRTAAANEGNLISPPPALVSQTIADGDYIQYDVTVGTDSGIRRYDFRDVNETQMTIDVTSTIWYFGSASYTTDYSYRNGMIVIPGLIGGLTSENKTGEANISTAYGMKHVNVFSYIGAWSDQPSPADLSRPIRLPDPLQVLRQRHGWK